MMEINANTTPIRSVQCKICMLLLPLLQNFEHKTSAITINIMVILVAFPPEFLVRVLMCLCLLVRCML